MVDAPYRGALSFGVLQLTDWMCRRTGGSGCGNGYRRDDETKLLTLFVMTREHGALFGVGLETGIDQVSEILRLARVFGTAGLDLVSLTDHPYFAERIDAYATLSFVLGATTNISAAAVMTNLLSRPAPILARTATRAARRRCSKAMARRTDIRGTRTPCSRLHLPSRSRRHHQQHDAEPLGTRSRARRPRSNHQALTSAAPIAQSPSTGGRIVRSSFAPDQRVMCSSSSLLRAPKVRPIIPASNCPRSALAPRS